MAKGQMPPLRKKKSSESMENIVADLFRADHSYRPDEIVQWLDEDSIAYLKLLSSKEIKPIIIIAPCRYLDQGEKVDLQSCGHLKVDMELGSLSGSGSESLIKLAKLG